MDKRRLQQNFDDLRNQQKTLGKQIGPLQGALKKASDDAAKAADVLFNSSRMTGNSIDSVTQAFSRIHSTLGALTPPLGQLGLVPIFVELGLLQPFRVRRL